jgi:RHS repeat-associated protein
VPVWQQISVTATNSGSSSNWPAGYVFVPKTDENFTYDQDGNLTSDGRFNYTWDGEGRLKQVESLATGPTASKRRVVWEYDGQGRRVRQTIYTGASGSYVITSDLKLLNDGWRCVAELNATNNALVRSYTWGLDLSGSMDGAGGVGGLLVTRNADLGTRNFVAHDGNGNVTGLVSAGDGTVTGNYEYDPFGQTIRLSGPAAKDNPWRFSTKRVDNETDLVWYEYRAYSPSLGRFIARDPAAETQSSDYLLASNDCLDHTDYLGLATLWLHVTTGHWTGMRLAAGTWSQPWWAGSGWYTTDYDNSYVASYVDLSNGPGPWWVEPFVPRDQVYCNTVVSAFPEDDDPTAGADDAGAIRVSLVDCQGGRFRVTGEYHVRVGGEGPPLTSTHEAVYATAALRKGVSPKH